MALIDPTLRLLSVRSAEHQHEGKEPTSRKPKQRTLTHTEPTLDSEQPKKKNNPFLMPRGTEILSESDNLLKEE